MKVGSRFDFYITTDTKYHVFIDQLRCCLLWALERQQFYNESGLHFMIDIMQGVQNQIE